MSHLKNTRIFLLTIALAVMCLTAFAKDEAPQAMVENITKSVLDKLKSQKGNTTSAEAVEQAIYNLILPNMDFDSMAKLVLRDEWKKADDTQKQNFIKAFQELLVGTYTKALVRFSDEEIVFLPFEPGSKPEKLSIVKSEVKKASGAKTPIEYKLRFKPEDKWKVYDIDIEGVSLVTNYRSSFSREISIGGMEHLIKLLNEQNQKNKLANKS